MISRGAATVTPGNGQSDPCLDKGPLYDAGKMIGKFPEIFQEETKIVEIFSDTQ